MSALVQYFDGRNVQVNNTVYNKDAPRDLYNVNHSATRALPGELRPHVVCGFASSAVGTVGNIPSVELGTTGSPLTTDFTHHASLYDTRGTVIRTFDQGTGVKNRFDANSPSVSVCDTGDPDKPTTVFFNWPGRWSLRVNMLGVNAQGQDRGGFHTIREPTMYGSVIRHCLDPYRGVDLAYGGSIADIPPLVAQEYEG